MSLELAVAGVLVAALIIYLLTGGADFGGGVWDLLASGPRKQEQRDAIERAIGPVWETNHIWLILAIVVLFTAFPRAFAAYCTAFHLPLTLFLVGIVLRGSAFVFRHALSDQPKPRKRWGLLFSSASVIAPVLLGVVVGGAASGRVRFENGVALPWVGPFALSVGALTLAICALLAATYLAVETEGALRKDFVTRATAAAVTVGVLALVSALLATREAPSFIERLTGRPESIVMMDAPFALLIAGIWMMRRDRVALARMIIATGVVLILGGWAVAQYPFLLAPNVTVQGAAANPKTLKLAVIALASGFVVLLPSLFLLLRIFKGANARTGNVDH